MDVLLAASTTERATDLVAQLAGMAILAGMIAVVAAFLYRWYVREPIPMGLAILLGLGAVAALLNTTTVLGEIIVGDDNGVTQVQEALFNIAAFAAGVGGAAVGRGLGDGFGTDVFDATTFAEVDEGVGRLVKAVGRVVTVELPDEIDDVVGYDPVPEATKAELAGRSFVFPRRLTVAELRDRLVARLKTDYAVGHVDIELADDGTVEYLALGSRAAGIGPTLPPATNAVAIRADPAFAASAGDLVQVWETDPTRRILTAELRGVADDVVTVAIDAADTAKLDPTQEYRLVTLPVEDRPDREFASLLRAADETFASVTVQAGSPLHGAAVGGLDVAVISVTPEGGQPDVLPAADRVLAPGEVVNAIARPDALRQLEDAATLVDPAVESSVGAESPAGATDSGLTDDASVGGSEGPTVDDEAAAAPGEGTARTDEEVHVDDGSFVDDETADDTETLEDDLVDLDEGGGGAFDLNLGEADDDETGSAAPAGEASTGRDTTEEESAGDGDETRTDGTDGTDDGGEPDSDVDGEADGDDRDDPDGERRPDE